MSQEKYKRKGHNWRDARREQASSRSREERFMHLVNNFRGIDLRDDGEDEELDPAACGPFADPDEDWNNPKPVVDLRTFNFALPGILCPFCRQALMLQDEGSGQLSCSCSSVLETKTPITAIKQAVQEVVQQHANCPSQQSPDYTMFKSRIVLTCTVCQLLAVVS